MTRPTAPRMPPIISACPLQRIRFEVFMTCQVSRPLWNAGDALEACPMDDAEDQVGNRLRPPPLSPRPVHPAGSSNPVDGDLVQVATSKPGPEDMIVPVFATGVRRTGRTPPLRRAIPRAALQAYIPWPRLRGGIHRGGA